ncbi:MAG: Clp protease [Euzebyaceae bacterium]|jgi:ATP-dependent Clp protease ATP-binding subunit ClpA|nr:Clp protease [Euzebyaceae bacterium]
MFERFTDRARYTVVLAQTQAREQRASHIGTEHLLVGLLAEGEGVAASVLRSAGLTLEHVRTEILHVVGPDGLGHEDADALQAIGIDLGTVRARIEEAFGPGALDRAARRGRRRWRRCHTGSSGHIPFSPRAKKALELSLREALRLQHNYIGTEHVLLGILHEGRGVAAVVLARRGINADDLRRQVLAAVGKAA